MTSVDSFEKKQLSVCRSCFLFENRSTGLLVHESPESGRRDGQVGEGTALDRFDGRFFAA